MPDGGERGVPVPPVVRRGSRVRRIAWGFAPVLTSVGLIATGRPWCRSSRFPTTLVPAPQAVIPRLIQARQALWVNSMITLREIIFGFAITVVLSIPLGLLLALSLLARRLAYPVLVFIQLVPKIAIAPLFLVWFGFGIQSKVLLTVLLTFFPLLLASIAGIQALNAAPVPDSIHGSFGLADLLARAVSQPSLRMIFSGLEETAATIAATAAIVAEFVGSNSDFGSSSWSRPDSAQRSSPRSC